MKPIIYTSVLFGALFIVLSANAQENVKTTAAPAEQTNQTVETKAQNNNTVRSNRTEVKVAIDQPNSGNNHDANSNSVKKGYDLYKAKSDLNSAEIQTKAQDHNSSRSNKTGSVIAPNNPETGSNSVEKEISPNEKTDKSEAARAKKKQD